MTCVASGPYGVAPIPPDVTVTPVRRSVPDDRGGYPVAPPGPRRRGAHGRRPPEWVRAWWLGDNDRVTQPLQATAPTTPSSALFERARAVTPGGVNSPVRAFNAVGGTPRFIRSAPGAWLTDVDGNEYVDLICSWGPMLLGHAHPEVQAAVAAAVARGTSYGTPTEPEVELAEEIVARTPVERGPPRLLAAPRPPCRRSGWPAASPAATSS